MTRVPPVDTASLAPADQQAVAAAEKMMGFTANDVLTMARQPNVMHAFAALVNAIYSTPEVSPGLKRMIALMTSSAAGCRYCVGHTALSSTEQGVDADKLSAIWDFESSEYFSPAERAALRVAMLAGQSPNGVTDDDFAALRPHFSEDAQLEIVAVISLFGFLNRWNATLATDLEDRPAKALQGVSLPVGAGA